MKSLVATRKNLMYVFLCSLIVQILLFFISSLLDITSYKNLTGLTTNILKIYSTHIAVIFSSFCIPKQKNIIVSSKTYYLSLTLALFWNMLLLLRTITYFIDTTFLNNSQDTVNNVIVFHKDVSELSSFVIVGLIAYFFQSKEDQE